MEKYDYIKSRNTDAAQSFFIDIIKKYNLNDAIPEGFEDKTISEMSGENKWLSPWMIKTEEIWSVVAGDENRLWDVFYEKDPYSSCGLSVRSMEDSDKVIQDTIRMSDLVYEHKEDDTDGEGNPIPVSLKYLIGIMSFASCFRFENGKLQLTPDTPGLMDYGNNIYFPYNREIMIQKGYSDLIRKRTKEAFLVLANDKKKIEKELKEYNLKENKSNDMSIGQ